ncbi:MAG TPA: CopG family transcriptional regulator [Thermoanaerobaculia bacterium]|nr:CopG family transcriptional regulator [Thermoanaerobaculia bacterium]
MEGTVNRQELAEALDRFVASRPRNDRAEALEAALAENVGRLARTLLARDCAECHKAIAEEGMAGRNGSAGY